MDAHDKWYIEQFTAPAMMNRNAIRFGNWTFQRWKNGAGEIKSITYAEGWRIMKELSGGLLDMGFQKGDRGALMCHTCPEWVWADYSILCSGGITVCIYPSLSEAEMCYIINDSGASILYLQDETTLAKVIKSWDKLPELKQVIVMKEDYQSSDSRVTSFGDLRKRGVALLARDRYAFEKRWRAIELTDYMTIVYTSGTTGTPKGAVHTHLSFNAAICRDLRDATNYREGDVLLSFLPLSHTYERECGHGAAMMAGVTIAYTTPKDIVRDLQLFRPHIFMSVPRIYERVYLAMKDMASKSFLTRAIFNAAMDTGRKVVETRADSRGFIAMDEFTDLSKGAGFWLGFKYRLFDALVFKKVRDRFGGRIRCAFSAAGSLPADLCKSFMAMGFVILEGYGLTETWNTINLNRPGKILPGSVGPVSSGVVARIAEDGEWQVRGDNLFVGYWNKPQDTAEAFTEDGYFKTGDIVEEVGDGYVKIVDRKKGIMVLDTGKNVPSARIESLFALSQYVEMVVPIADDRKFVSALVVPDFDAFIKFFKEKGISYDKSALEFSQEGTAPVCIKVGNDFVANEKLKELIDADIKKANLELEEYEQIKKYYILNRKLMEQYGEMTPTLKVKRKAVLGTFKEQISNLYK
jgi:long-chain acyl-CoA synthetase